MFKHILIPADDDPGSRRAFVYGVEVAKRFGARITGFHVMSEFTRWTGLAELLEPPPDKLLTEAEKHSAKVLAPLERLAEKSGVRCDAVSEPGEDAAEAIIKAAKRLKCDLIVMASHGRVGLARCVVGSETRKVLDRGSLPVLVVR